MSCGTALYAAMPGEVLARDAPGSPGPSYGVNPVRLRVDTARGPAQGLGLEAD